MMVVPRSMGFANFSLLSRIHSFLALSMLITLAGTVNVGELKIEYMFSNLYGVLDNGGSCDMFSSGCDTFIRFCITMIAPDIESTGGRCGLSSHLTETFNSYGRTGQFSTKIPLSKKPGHSYLDLSAEARDFDKVSSADLIGKFSSVRKISLLPNDWTSVRMDRVERASSSGGATLDLRLLLSCNENYYGSMCSKYCRPVEGMFTCDKDGNRVCQGNKAPPLCEYDDVCKPELKPCADHARCEDHKNGKRTCHCDAEDKAKCYLNHKSCDPNPCLNNGRCAKSKSNPYDDECICNKLFTGRHCERRREPCTEEAAHIAFGPRIIEPDQLAQLYADVANQTLILDVSSVCLNGGQCVSNAETGDWSCQCASEWKGKRCEYKTSAAASDASFGTNWTLVSALMILVFLLLISLVVGLSIWLKHRKRRQLKKEATQAREQVYGNMAAAMMGQNPAQIYAGLPNPYPTVIYRKSNHGIYDSMQLLPPSYIGDSMLNMPIYSRAPLQMGMQGDEYLCPGMPGYPMKPPEDPYCYSDLDRVEESGNLSLSRKLPPAPLPPFKLTAAGNGGDLPPPKRDLPPVPTTPKNQPESSENTLTLDEARISMQSQMTDQDDYNSPLLPMNLSSPGKNDFPAEKQ